MASIWPRPKIEDVKTPVMTVPTLLNCSVVSVIMNMKMYMGQLEGIPPHLKEKCLRLLSKRGMLTDGNINEVLHEKVRKLDFSDSDISDAGLHLLKRCPQLEKLDLNSAKSSRTNVTSSGIQHVASMCSNLRIVYLRRCLNITDDAIIALATSCRRLTELNIGGCRLLTDRSLQALGQNCSYLQSINFSQTLVTDDGVYSLVSGCCGSSLNEIHMNGCLEVTDEAVEAVTQCCPKISILIFHGCPKLTEQSRLALEELNVGTKIKHVTWTVY